MSKAINFQPGESSTTESKIVMEIETVLEADLVETQCSGTLKTARLVSDNQELFVDLNEVFEGDYDAEPTHPEMDAIIGKRLRITVEVID